MADEWKRAATRAAKLAAWTSLKAGEFEDCYFYADNSARAPAWAVLEANVSANDPAADAQALIGAACSHAEQEGFLGRLAENVARVESSKHHRDDFEIAELFNEIGDGGIMQAMTAPARSLMDTAIFGALQNAADACATVLEGDDLRGTAFLVSPDMVLTAAHVVLAQERDGDGHQVWVGRLRPNLSFAFAQPRGSPDSRRMRIPAAGETPVVSAFPHGKPPNVLDPSLEGDDPPARLDFALVRLSRQVHHLPWLDIREPLDPQEGRHCFVMGFPAGEGLKFDADAVTVIHKQSGRFLHRANTAPGMSGGCCVGPEGTVIALHEGALPRLGANRKPLTDEKGETIYDNRAICLTKVRALQRELVPDPLDASGKAPGISFSDPQLVEDLYRTGLRLAGAELQGHWRGTFQAMYGLVGPLGVDQAMPDFHPWFRRKPFEEWIDKAAGATSARLCFVNSPAGVRGSGKSFCGQIAAAKINHPILNLVRLTSTQTSAWSWEEAINAALRSAGAVIQGSEAATRLSAGAIKYDDVPLVIDAFSGLQGRKRVATTPLFIIIDFEEGARLHSGQAHWYNFVKALAQQEWARLVVIGLAESERLDIRLSLQEDAVTREVELTEVELGHLTESDLLLYLMDLATSRNVEIAFGFARQEVAKLWHSELMLRGVQPALQTAEAALCAALLEKTIPHG